MMKTAKRITVNLFLTFALISCMNQQGNDTTIPAVSIDRIQSITPTPHPASTPSPTLPPLPTVPVSTLNAIATLDVVKGELTEQRPELENYKAFCYPSYCYGADISPNGQYIIFTNGNKIELFKINGQQVGEYSFYDYFDYSQDLGDGNTSITHWSKDGNYVYISTFSGDSGYEPYFGYKSSLVRMNLENGTWKDTGISGVISFSPNDRYVAYSTNHSEIRVRDLLNGKEKIYFSADEYLYFGHFVWSSESKKVVFVASPEDWDMPNGKFALYTIDLESNVISNLYETPFPFYYPINWSEPNKVTLNNYREFGEWALDLSVNPPQITP